MLRPGGRSGNCDLKHDDAGAPHHYSLDLVSWDFFCPPKWSSRWRRRFSVNGRWWLMCLQNGTSRGRFKCAMSTGSRALLHTETQAQFLLLIGAVSELVDWAKPRWTHLCIWGIKRTIKRNSQIIFHFQTFRPPVICCSTKPRYSWTLFKFCKGEKFLTLAARCHHVRAEAELSGENTLLTSQAWEVEI